MLLSIILYAHTVAYTGILLFIVRILLFFVLYCVAHIVPEGTREAPRA